MMVGIYGTGRFGSFWASTLARYAEVKTYNRSDRPVPPGCTGVALEDLGRCEAVMLCVAINAVEEALDALVGHLAPGTLVMDTCSVKVHPVRSMLDAVPAENPVIGTHPMFGPDSAGDGLDGLPIVLTPARADEATIERWERFLASTGLRVLRMSPEDHDREAAMTQGVTHLLGRVLADMDLEPSPIATMGYRKLLEVVEQTCNDPYQLFVDLQSYNPYTQQMRDRLQQSLARMTASLDTARERP